MCNSKLIFSSKCRCRVSHTAHLHTRALQVVMESQRDYSPVVVLKKDPLMAVFTTGFYQIETGKVGGANSFCFKQAFSVSSHETDLWIESEINSGCSHII